MISALVRNLSVQWTFSWNQIGQLAEHEIIQSGVQLVELGGIRALGVVWSQLLWTSQQIIHLVAAQPPVLYAACQQRNISQSRPQDILSSTKGIRIPRARRNFAVSESLSCCLDNTCPVPTRTSSDGNIRMITRNSPHSYQSPQSHLARATGHSKHKVQNLIVHNVHSLHI